MEILSALHFLFFFLFCPQKFHFARGAANFVSIDVWSFNVPDNLHKILHNHNTQDPTSILLLLITLEQQAQKDKMKHKAEEVLKENQDEVSLYVACSQQDLGS